MSDFNALAADYKKILEKDVRLSGEGPDYFARYKAECVSGFLGPGFSGRILDYGCGVGLVVKHLRGYFDRGGSEIVGYDVSGESIKQAGDISGVRLTSSYDEIREKPFDAIVVANVLHHVEACQRPDFVRSVARLLSSGGHIFIFEHNPYNPLTRITVKYSKLDEGASLLDLGEAGKLLKDAGLSLRERRYIVFFPKFLKKFRRFEPKLGSFPMGAQYMCVGRS